MHKAFQAQDHVLNELNFEFKELLICLVLQINCHMHLLIINLMQVVVLSKTTQLPIVNKRGRIMAIEQDYSC